MHTSAAALALLLHAGLLASGAPVSTAAAGQLGFGSNSAGSPQTLPGTEDVCIGRDPCFVLVDVPAGCEATPTSPSACPVVFKLHGSGGIVRDNARSDFTTSGFIAVYPQGANLPTSPGWNTGARSSNKCAYDDYDCNLDIDEGAFFAGVVKLLRAHGLAGNVFAYGSSNGAALAQRLASSAGEDLPFKGIIAVASQMLAEPLRSGPGVHNHNQPQQGGPPVCYMGIHGDTDGLIPYEGGALFTNKEHFALLSNDASNQKWADHNGCGTLPASGSVTTATVGAATVTHSVWDCPAAARVEHYRVHGGGHTGADKDLWGKIVGFVAACESEQGAAEQATTVGTTVGITGAAASSTAPAPGTTSDFRVPPAVLAAGVKGLSNGETNNTTTAPAPGGNATATAMATAVATAMATAAAPGTVATGTAVHEGATTASVPATTTGAGGNGESTASTATSVAAVVVAAASASALA